jgi:methylmalonyl-CoA/ethylmalonyl-CoA epimerase
MRFDHIGVAATTLEAGRAALRQVLRIADWSAEFADPLNHIYCQFGRDDSGVCYEVIAPLDEQSPIAKTVRTRRDTLHHVAYLVADLEAEARRLAAADCVTVTRPTPAVAYGGARIQFFFSGLGFVIEFIEAPGHKHLYTLAW